MTAEELLKTLRDGGLDDGAIQKLLSDCLASLTGPAENPEIDKEMDKDREREQAGKLLGVTL